MHYLTEVASDVDKTHPRLGNLVAMSMLAIKARKLLMVVSPRGCGKSRATSFVGYSHPKHSFHDRLSVAALGGLQSEFSGFDGVVVVDDIAKTQTHYARVTTMTTLAELVYSHYCNSNLQGATYDIQDFYGSALINIQPVLLRKLIESDEWEASMQDKSIRYYHLYRPLNPNPMPPTLRLKWGLELDKVEVPTMKGKMADKLRDLGEVQWGLARLTEHTIDFLKAAAALDNRYAVIASDYRLLLKVMMPMSVEMLVMTKEKLESERRFNADELALLTEYMTYGSFSLRHLSRDYKISQSKCQKIMAQYPRDWVVVAKSPTLYAPSRELMKRLKEIGLV